VILQKTELFTLTDVRTTTKSYHHCYGNAEGTQFQKSKIKILAIIYKLKRNHKEVVAEYIGFRKTDHLKEKN
jgi:hypothetical protein